LPRCAEREFGPRPEARRFGPSPSRMLSDVPITVILVEMPGLLRDLIVSAIARQDDMEIVAETGSDKLAEVAEAVAADVAIVGPGVSDHDIVAALHQHARLRVISTAEDSSARVLELKLAETTVEEITPRTLIGILRAGGA
jgi:DNA-binding NarL/FixJ family response regulator